MDKVDEVWTKEYLVPGSLDGVRKATPPMTEEENDVMLHLRQKNLKQYIKSLDKAVDVCLN